MGYARKIKIFVATLITDFDESISKLNLNSQELGRVLLNLYNNAFYAVHDKQKKNESSMAQESAEYVPQVTVSTKKNENYVEITVKDNGPGIPKKIIEKIFHPFFTTKPTGQGTGLGLSLSYDIVKAHGGELSVETSEGKGSVFNIQIPIS